MIVEAIINAIPGSAGFFMGSLIGWIVWGTATRAHHSEDSLITDAESRLAPQPEVLAKRERTYFWNILVLEFIDAIPEALAVGKATVDDQTRCLNDGGCGVFKFFTTRMISVFATVFILNLANTFSACSDYFSCRKSIAKLRVVVGSLQFSAGMVVAMFVDTTFASFEDEWDKAEERDVASLFFLLLGTALGMSTTIVLMKLHHALSASLPKEMDNLHAIFRHRLLKSESMTPNTLTAREAAAIAHAQWRRMGSRGSRDMVDSLLQNSEFTFDDFLALASVYGRLPLEVYYLREPFLAQRLTLPCALTFREYVEREYRAGFRLTRLGQRWVAAKHYLRRLGTTEEEEASLLASNIADESALKLVGCYLFLSLMSVALTVLVASLGEHLSDHRASALFEGFSAGVFLSSVAAFTIPEVSKNVDLWKERTEERDGLPVTDFTVHSLLASTFVLGIGVSSCIAIAL